MPQTTRQKKKKKRNIKIEEEIAERENELRIGSNRSIFSSMNELMLIFVY